VACWKCRTQKIAKNTPSGHHRTTLSDYIFATKACINNRKKNLLNSNTSSMYPDNMVNFGVLTAEICWRVLGTPANFNGFRVLAACHLYSAGRPSRWALSHISSIRMHRSTTYIDAAYCYRRSTMVCLSVKIVSPALFQSPYPELYLELTLSVYLPHPESDLGESPMRLIYSL